MALAASLFFGCGEAREEASPDTSESEPDEVMEESEAEPLAEAPAFGVQIGLDDPSGQALVSFYAALRRAETGEGTARLLFYGGSHTAADIYVGRLRELLQSRFGDSGHGFVPLVPVITAAWAWGIRIDDAEGWQVMQVRRKRPNIERYGLAGVAFQSTEAGAFAAVASDHWGSGRLASSLELFYDLQPGGGPLELHIDGRLHETLPTDAPSPRGARYAVRVSDGPHRVEVRAATDDPITVFGVAFERERPGVLVENLGLVGSKARHQLLWEQDLWREFLRSRSPDLVALAYGNNETTDTHLTMDEHRAHFDEVLSRIRAAVPEASCLVIGPTDRPRLTEPGRLEPRPIVAELTSMQSTVARLHGCAFFDTLSFQGGLGASIAWHAHDPPWVREDLQHLTRHGYRRWGEVLAEALLEGYR